MLKINGLLQASAKLSKIYNRPQTCNISLFLTNQTTQLNESFLHSILWTTLLSPRCCPCLLCSFYVLWSQAPIPLKISLVNWDQLSCWGKRDSTVIHPTLQPSRFQRHRPSFYSLHEHTPSSSARHCCTSSFLQGHCHWGPSECWGRLYSFLKRWKLSPG